MLYKELRKHYELFFKTSREMHEVLTQLQKILPLVQDDKDLLTKYADIYLRVRTAARLVRDAGKDFGDWYKSEEEKYRASLPEFSWDDFAAFIEEDFKINT